MYKLIFLIPLVLLFLMILPVQGDEVYDLERIINRAVEANWGMIDAHTEAQRAGLRVDASLTEFELKIYPAAGVGFSGGDEQSAAADLSLGINLEKKTQTGTVIGFTPSVQRMDGHYQNRSNFWILQPLLRGVGREYNLSGVYSARFSERSAMRALYQREVDTIVGAVRSGYEVVRQSELFRLRQESHERLEELSEATALKERMGLVNAIDLYRVRIQLNQAEEELNRSRESLVESLDNLKIFLALPLDMDINVVLPLDFDRIYPDEDIVIQTALSNRVELEHARDALSEARRLSERSKHELLPDLDIRLSFVQAGEPSSRFPGSAPDQSSWGVSLGSTTDFRRTSERAFYEDSLINVRQVSRRQRITKDEIIAQVKREVRNLERLDKAIINQEEQIHQAKGQLELARIKFGHGMADNFDVIDAEIALRRSQTQLLSAVIEYIVGQYRLRAVIGTLVER